MSKSNGEWAPRRFWTEVAAVPAETVESLAAGWQAGETPAGQGIAGQDTPDQAGPGQSLAGQRTLALPGQRSMPLHGQWTVTLDGKPVRTPAKAPLLLPTPALAALLAGEWAAQGEKIDPATMPATRMANSAIDKVTPQHAEVAALVAAYGGSDLLCYRAAHPEALVALQRAWDGPLDWCAGSLGLRLETVIGVMPRDQDPKVLAGLAERVAALPPFELAPFHDLVALSGSLVLALALLDGAIQGPDAWRLSRIDEDFEAGQWGQDEEAMAFAAAKETDFLFALDFLRAARG